MKKVAIIMGSDSDWPVVKGAVQVLKGYGIPFEAHVLSAHRTPAEAAHFARTAQENGFGVLIAAAGGAVVEIVKAIRPTRKIAVYRTGDVVRVEVEGAGRGDIPAAVKAAKERDAE